MSKNTFLKLMAKLLCAGLALAIINGGVLLLTESLDLSLGSSKLIGMIIPAILAALVVPFIMTYAFAMKENEELSFKEHAKVLAGQPGLLVKLVALSAALYAAGAGARALFTKSSGSAAEIFTQSSGGAWTFTRIAIHAALIAIYIYFCRNILRAHSGSAFASSKVKRGTAVLLLFFIIWSSLPVSVYAETDYSAKVNRNFRREIIRNEVSDLEPAEDAVTARLPEEYPEAEDLSRGEVEVARDVNSIIYETGENTYTARIFASPVMYEDESGELQEIDNTLVASRGGTLINAANSYRVTLPGGDSAAIATAANTESVASSTARGTSAAAEANGITIEKDGYTVRIEPAFSALKNPTVRDNAVRYNGVLKNIDIQYTALGDSVKEDIIVNGPTEVSSFTYKVTAPGLTFTERAGIIFAVPEESANAWTDAELYENATLIIKAPLARDSGGNVNQDITLSLAARDEASHTELETAAATRAESDSSPENAGGEYILTVSVSPEWLNAPERVYPVYIDPKIELTMSNLAWALVTNGVGALSGPDEPHPYNSYLYAGFEDGTLVGMGDRIYGTTRSYIRINFDGLKNISIPDNAIVTAKLHAYKYTWTKGENVKVFCQMVTTAWDPFAVTWNKRPTSVNYEAAAGSTSVDVTGGAKWAVFDISNPVRLWLSGQQTNYGLALVPEKEEQFAAVFAGPDNEHGMQPMYFEISWTVPNPVDENLPLNAPRINLRTLTKSEKSGAHKLNAVFADGVVRPNLKVTYELRTVKTNSKVASGVYQKAEYEKKYPDSRAFTGISFDLGYAGINESNWQSDAFTAFEKNKLYAVFAKGESNAESTPEGKSDEFILYEFTEQDTLPYVAAYYGVPLETIISDNHTQDYLAFPGNTFFIRNPNENAETPYTRPDDLTDERKRELIYANLGRGLHSEFDLEPINPVIGNFYFESIDAESKEHDGTFLLSRAYNSIGNKASLPFGTGWGFAYSAHLSGGESGSIKYIMADGRVITFTYDEASNSYIAPLGYDLNLRKILNTDINPGEAFDPGKTIYEIEETDGKEYIFSAFGVLTKVISKAGLATEIKYDDKSHIEGITTSSGRLYSFKTDNSGRITEITLPNGGTLKYGYTGDFLTRYENADGDVVKYSYDALGRMTSWEDGRGNTVIRNTFDDKGRVVSQEDAEGNVSYLTYQDDETKVVKPEGEEKVYAYDENLRVREVAGLTVEKKKEYTDDSRVKSIEEEVVRTEYAYDATGNITKEERPDGTAREFTYDDRGNALSITDFDGTESHNSYDAKGNLTETVRSDGSKVSYTYDEFGRVTSVTDGRGAVTSFTYFGNEKMVETDPLGNAKTFYYDPMGRLVSMEDSEGYIERIIYSKAGKKLKEIKGDSETEYTYDGAGNVIRMVDPEGNASTFTYDKLNRMTSAINPLGASIIYAYDEAGNKVSEIDALGNETQFSYNESGKVVLKIDPLGRETKYEYDLSGRRITEDAPDGKTEYEYDDLSRVSKVINARGETEYTYDAFGNVIKTIFPDGTEESAEYNALGRITESISKSGLVTNFTYDAEGNLIEQKDSAGRTYSYTYDAAGHLLTETDALGNTRAYAYDGAGRRVSAFDALGNETKYVYDKSNNIIETIHPDGGSEEFSYDKNGNVVSHIDENENEERFIYNGVNKRSAHISFTGSVTTYEYDAAERLVLTKDPVSAETRVVYDALGRVAETIDPEGNKTENTYDEKGNIVEIKYPNGGIAEFSYDEKGDLVREVSKTGLVTEYTYDALGRKLTEKNSEGKSLSFTYDAEGRLISEKDSLGRESEYIYDTHGNLISEKTLQGFVTEYEYDPLGRAVSKTLPSGLRYEYTYDGNGNLISSKDNLGSEITYSYDARGRMTSVINPLGEKTEYIYDAKGSLTEEKNARGAVTQSSYDADGNLVSKTDAEGGVYSYAYDPARRMISEETPLGFTAEYAYDLRGLLVAKKDALGNVTNYEYDGEGNLIKTINPNTGVTEYSYDASGFLTQEVGPEGEETSYTYFADGKFRTKKIPSGLVYTYSYDEAGRVTELRDSLGAGRSTEYAETDLPTKEISPLGYVTEYEYDKAGNVVSVTYPNGSTKKSEYDLNGNVIKVTSPSGAVTEFTYDSLSRITKASQDLTEDIFYTYDEAGNVIEKIQGEIRETVKYDLLNHAVETASANGSISKVSYDADGRKISETDALGAVTTFEYDAVGNQVRVTDPEGNATEYSYDAIGNVTKKKDALGNAIEFAYDLSGNQIAVRAANGAEVKYTYGKSGEILTRTAPGNRVTAFTYDKHGNTLSMRNPDGSTESFAYDLEDRLVSEISMGGRKTEYTYNELGAVTEKKYSGGASVEYTYNLAGDRVLMRDSLGETKYSYDILGSMTSVTDPEGRTVKYSYDTYGRVSGLTYPEGRKVHYSYDPEGNLIKVGDSSLGDTSYTYDKAGRVIKAIMPSGTVSTYSYDKLGNLLTLDTKDKSGALISSFTYTYDALSNIVTSKETISGETVSLSYTYDEVNELTEAVRTEGAKTEKTTYSYDLSGNRIEATVGAGRTVTERKHDAMGRIISETGTDGSIAYTYDSDGNLIKKATPDGTFEYAYSEAGLLKTVTKDGKVISAYSYDGDGNRVISLNLDEEYVPHEVYNYVAGDGDKSDDVKTDGGKNGENAGGNENAAFDTSAFAKLFGRNYKNPSLQEGLTSGESSIFVYGILQGLISYFVMPLSPALAGYLAKTLYDTWGAAAYGYTNALGGIKISEYGEKNSGVYDESKDAYGELLLGVTPGEGAASDTNSSRAPEYSVIASTVYLKEEVYRVTYYVNDILRENAEVISSYSNYGNHIADFIYGNARIAEESSVSGTATEYIYDGRGSVRASFDSASGELTDTFSYDSLGGIMSCEDSYFIGFAFNGEEYTEQTGLIYLRARYYDTNSGIFISADTYLGTQDNIISQNRYAYANNDPVNTKDPTGHYGEREGVMRYYESTGLNELRDFMTAAALWTAEADARNSFNGSIANAAGTSMFNYNTINGISQATANRYIAEGIYRAGEASMNYGCSVPTVPYTGVAKLAYNVNLAKAEANTVIYAIRESKKAEYDSYQAYLALQAELERLAQEEAAHASYHNVRGNYGRNNFTVVNDGDYAYRNVRGDNGRGTTTVVNDGYRKSSSQSTQHSRNIIKMLIVQVATEVHDFIDVEYRRYLNEKGRTRANGIDVSGIYAVANISVQGGLGLDSEGTLFVYGQYVGGGAASFGSASIALAYTTSNAPTVEDFLGEGALTGFSAAGPVMGVPLMGGGEYTTMYKDGTPSGYSAITTYVGLGTPGFEIHSATSTTVGKPIGNIFDANDFWLELIIEWGKS